MPKRSLVTRALIALLAGLPVLAHVLWEYFHGGITAHHLLARQDLPAISNGWGLLTIPVLAFYALWRVEKRTGKKTKNAITEPPVVIGFLLALALGIFLASLWEFGLADFMPFVLFSPLALAFFLPVYRAECLLGFVMGLTYTFGGVLPIFIGVLLCVLSYIIYRLVRAGLRLASERGSGDKQVD